MIETKSIALLQNGTEVSWIDIERYYCPPLQHEEEQQIYSSDRAFDELFEQVNQLPEYARPGFLDEKCHGNPVLRRRIEQLLEGCDSHPPDDFLDPSTVKRLIQYATDPGARKGLS